MSDHILAFGAHPDDVECAAGGSLLVHIAQGGTATVVDITRGELGSRGDAETRAAEAAEASRLLGIRARHQLGMPDGGITADETWKQRIVGLIRKERPAIILCNALRDRHPDHEAAGRLVAQAAFLSGLRNYAVGTGEPWRPRLVLHYIQDLLVRPDIIINISPHIDRKMEAVHAFASQFQRTADAAGPGPAPLPDHIRAMDQVFGREIGVRYGEGFTVARSLGAGSLSQLL